MARRKLGPKPTVPARRSTEHMTIPGIMEELLETSNAIIIGIDPEGHVRLFNNGARRALGYTFEEVEGRPWFDLLADSDAEKGRMDVFRFDIGSGARTQYESRVVSSSGLIVTISIENTVIFDHTGEISMVLMVGQDVSRTKELERTLKEKNDRLVEAMEELKLYADLLLHDMKNANAGIMGYLDLIGMGASDERTREYSDKALSEVRRATSIINDVKVVTLTRPEWSPSPMDLDEVLARSIARTMEGMEPDSVRLEVERSGLHVMADELLEEALIRAFRECTDLSVKGTRVTIDVKRDASRGGIIPQPVHIKVSADKGARTVKGAGVAFPLPPSADKGSADMGMYIVRRIVGRYNGLVWTENDGKGRSLHLLLSEAV